MDVVSLFSGIGGFDLGFQNAGMSIVFQCEIDTFAQQVLRKHWPDVPLHDDINTLESSSIPEADLYCGGFPCQDVSLANQGKRQGLNGTRSGLFFKFAELIEQRKPRWVVLENVPGLLNSQNGNDFKVVAGTLDKIGYGVAWRVLDAKHFGVPQRRRRVFIVASYQSLRAAGVLFDDQRTPIPAAARKGQKTNFAAGNGKSDRRPNLYSIQHAGVGRQHKAGPQGPGYRNDGETWTLDHRGSADVVCSPDDPFRIRAATRLRQGVDRNRYQALGNAVCVHVVEWIGRRILEVEAGEIDIPPHIVSHYNYRLDI